jgi:hypothetical protein
MTLIEKIGGRFPKLPEGLKKASEKTAAWQDMSLCAAVTFACAFYEYEKFLPAFATDAIKSVLAVLFAVCWLYGAFLSGYRGKYGFLVYAAVFWTLPRLVILKAESAGILGYDKYADAAARFSRLITDASAAWTARGFGVPVFYVIISLLMWCAALFYAGTRFKKCFTEIKEKEKTT